jgi:hypothetical protein
MTMAEALAKSATFFDGAAAASLAIASRTLDNENADEETRLDVLCAMRAKLEEEREEWLDKVRAGLEALVRSDEPPTLH